MTDIKDTLKEVHKDIITNSSRIMWSTDNPDYVVKAANNIIDVIWKYEEEE